MSVNEPGFVIRLALALAVDAAFGVVFNRWVAQHQARSEGVYTAFYVVFGVLVTLLSAVLVIGVSETLLVALLFTASGLPMILGAMRRHTDRIAATNETAMAAARELLNGTPGEE
jgi:uncharacterized integral membrane protein